MNYDITFCSKKDCKNLECKRNKIHFLNTADRVMVWESDFVECEHWKE